MEKTKLVNYSLTLPFSIGEQVKVRVEEGRTSGYINDIFLDVVSIKDNREDSYDNFQDLKKAFGPLSSCRYKKIKHNPYNGVYTETAFQKGLTDTNYTIWISTKGEIFDLDQELG